jgi:hypothetical protein
MTFKYHEGDRVALKEDHTDFLPAGTHGIVFCYYTTTPPAYEINFALRDGEDFGAIMFEDDIEFCSNSCCLGPAKS